MKRCPKCDRDYPDDTLNFCLEDGEALLSRHMHGEATAILPPSAAELPTRRFGLSDEVSGTSWFSKRTLILAALAVGMLGLGIALYSYYKSAPNQQIESIAVLPFQNAGGNIETEYLSDGIAESLINNLTELSQLKVTGRSTAFRYKGKDLDPAAVGRELNVKAVLTGSVRQIGDKLNIQVDLIDTSNGAQLWGREYERGMADVVAVKQSIAREVAERLRVRLTGEQEKQLTSRDTADPEAYQLYLKGRYFWGKRTAESIKKAIDYFDQSISRDPTYALAYAGLADAYVVPANRMPPREAMPRAKAAAMRALELDDTLAEAHTSLGRVLQVYDWNWQAAEKEFKRAIELNPRYPVAHQWFGGYLERTGNPEGGIAERKVALELDPLSAITSFELGQAYFFTRNYDLALEQYQKTLELDPEFPAVLQYIPSTYAQKGMYDVAIAKIRETPESADIDSTGAPGHTYALAGRRQEAIRMAEQLKQMRNERYISAVGIAMIYAGLGEKDLAFQWLEKGYEERAFQMQLINVDPRWDGLRDDPRFNDLLKRIGLAG